MNAARTKITEIMNNKNSSITSKAELKEVCSEFEENFKFLEEPNQFYPYTCLQYCLGCTPKSENEYIAYMQFKNFSHVPVIDMEFLAWLIENGFIIASEKPVAKFITYWENAKLVHIGFYLGELEVISKWGSGGPLIKHGIFEVPSCYGENIQFFNWSGIYNIIELINEFLDMIVKKEKV